MNTNTTPKTKACIPQKKQYKVTNWKEYNASLVARGSVTLWFNIDVLAAWNKPVQPGKAGHPKMYSDIAIQTALTI